MTVVLVSGGLDSAVCLALNLDHDPTALFVDYGQPHVNQERSASWALASHYNVGLVSARVDYPWLADRDDPTMLVPGRNLMLLAFAAALVQSRDETRRVVIGCHSEDWAVYPDCRLEFLGAAEKALGVVVDAPLAVFGKRTIGHMALELDVPLGLLWSCYYPTTDGQPCGECDACAGRARAFEELRVMP